MEVLCLLNQHVKSCRMIFPLSRFTISKRFNISPFPPALTCCADLGHLLATCRRNPRAQDRAICSKRLIFYFVVSLTVIMKRVRGNESYVSKLRSSNHERHGAQTSAASSSATSSSDAKATKKAKVSHASSSEVLTINSYPVSVQIRTMNNLTFFIVH